MMTDRLARNPEGPQISMYLWGTQKMWIIINQKFSTAWTSHCLRQANSRSSPTQTYMITTLSQKIWALSQIAYPAPSSMTASPSRSILRSNSNTTSTPLWSRRWRTQISLTSSSVMCSPSSLMAWPAWTRIYEFNIISFLPFYTDPLIYKFR